MIRTWLGLAALAALAGCGVDGAPVAPAATTATQVTVQPGVRVTGDAYVGMRYN
ncbi:argininosuccinate lyase [Paracoccus sanguinis]|uniref:argininosuccinate lyase n=1 Tax=Paracoccus sanguinis TaxID=1545044 RepID=UPI000A90E25F|nr:argininosuccinate lyase [Paracoccus sanguinis]